MNRSLSVLLVVAVLLGVEGASAQEAAGWERRSGPTASPVTVFHSTQAVNLPTAETLRRGEWLFEISHRFLPTVADGADALWGFDGPVFNRLGLAYAATDRFTVGVLRTNVNDNLEVSAKVRLAEGEGESISWMLAAMGGLALNTQEPAGAESNESQAYGQLIVNALFGGRFALGVVPTGLYNPVLQRDTQDWDLALGLNGQFYLSDQVSLLWEWIVTQEHEGEGIDLEHDGGSFGVELETGGHFFKIILTNQVRMNPTQFLAGSAFPFEPDELRVGFNITRLLAF